MKSEKEQKNSINNNVLFSTIISIIVLIVLVVGASFAYFMVNTNMSGSETKINVNIPDVGSVKIESSEDNLVMDLTAMQMIQLGKDTTYYASINGTTTTETTENVGKISASGNGTFDCNYELEVKATSKTEDSNLYTKFQNMSNKSEEQIVFYLIDQQGTKTYDFNTAGLFPITHKSVAKGLKNGDVVDIKAQLKLVNKTSINQDALESGDISLTVSLKSFSCDLVG